VNAIFTTSGRPSNERIGHSFASNTDPPEGSRDMVQIFRRYLEYRRVGLGRLAALRCAWLVVNTRSKPMSIR
jgi:hypothetical protein